MKKAIFFLFVFLSYIPALAQVDTAWVRRYEGLGNADEYAIALAVDDSGNVYVTGHSGVNPFLECVTIKYAPNGDTLWVRRYNGPDDYWNRASALAVDKDRNVYVTGYSYTVGILFLIVNPDYLTIKYAPNGDTLWVRRYDGPANLDDEAIALVVDDSGNVYVTGQSWGGPTTYSDYATIKYSPNGDTLWVRRYDGPGNYYDHANALAVDNSGNVYVAGSSYFSSTGWDYTIIKYAPNGDTLWVRHYNGSSDSTDEVRALAVDENGNAYVTGSSSGSGTLSDFATIKYAPNGDTLWVRRYNGPGNYYDHANDLAVDDSGNVYVTGSSPDTVTGQDYTTIKYTPDGDVLWLKRYNGPVSYNDFAEALAVDDKGAVYVTGTSSDGFFYDFATIKYSPDGDSLWIRSYNGPGNDIDFPYDLVVDGNGNVYVTGLSLGSEYNLDYATIKYIQFACSAKPGDANSDNNILLSDIVTIINFLFKSQPAPNPSCRADANADGNVLLPDIIYLINFLFKSGPAPQKSRECCL